MASLKQEIETWAGALDAYDKDDLSVAMDLFLRIADQSRILVNLGLCSATLGSHEEAIGYFEEAVLLDKHLAVAFFQCGVSHFLLGNWEAALDQFAEAIVHLRGNSFIDYEQLGLKFQLYAAEVYFNQGLCHIYAGRIQEGMADMREAQNFKATPEHDVIGDAIQAQGEDFTVFSIPVGVLYRPNAKKIANLKTKDYMGKTKLAAGSEANATNTTFVGEVRPREFKQRELQPILLGRSATRAGTTDGPPPRAPVTGAGLARSGTTINVPSDARDRIAGLSAGGPPPNRTPSNASQPQGRRGSVGDRPALSPALSSAPAPLVPKPKPQAEKPEAANPSRLTEFYDDFLDNYGGEEGEAPPLPMPANQQRNLSERVRAANMADAYDSPATPSRMTSLRNNGSNGGGSVSGGSMRRKVTRRTTTRSRAPSYYEEEEGYGSGEYEDGPFELSKIRVKLHYQDDIRGMAITPELPWEDFMDRITSKFAKKLTMKFMDEDNTKVSLRDESDYELAIETARDSADGKPEGRLTIYLTEA